MRRHAYSGQLIKRSVAGLDDVHRGDAWLPSLKKAGKRDVPQKMPPRVKARSVMVLPSSMEPTLTTERRLSPVRSKISLAIVPVAKKAVSVR